MLNSRNWSAELNAFNYSNITVRHTARHKTQQQHFAFFYCSLLLCGHLSCTFVTYQHLMFAAVNSHPVLARWVLPSLPACCSSPFLANVDVDGSRSRSDEPHEMINLHRTSRWNLTQRWPHQYYLLAESWVIKYSCHWRCSQGVIKLQEVHLESGCGRQLYSAQMWSVCLLLVGGVSCNLQAQFLVLWHYDVDTVLERHWQSLLDVSQDFHCCQKA